MTAPTPAEIAEVDGGINDDLVAAAMAPRDPDPYVAALQDDLGRQAARGDWARADDIHQQILGLQHPYLTLGGREAGDG